MNENKENPKLEEVEEVEEVLANLQKEEEINMMEDIKQESGEILTKKKKSKKIIIAVVLIIVAIIIASSIYFAIRIINESETTYVDGEFEVSKYYDEEGYFKGMKATKYVELQDINSIELPAELDEVSEETLELEISNILAGYPNTKEVTDENRVIVNGDIVNIDYVGSIDGVEFEGGSTQGFGTEVIIGETQYIDDFLEQLIGSKKGQNLDVVVTFPESYPSNPDLQNKEAVFNVTINGIYEEIEIVLDDEFVQANYAGTYQTAEEFKNDIKNNLVEEAKMNYVVEKLLEESTFEESPEKLVTFMKNVTRDQMYTEATYYGMTVEQYVQMCGLESFDAYYESQAEQTEQTLKLTIIYQAIAEENNLKVSDSDIEEFFLENYGSSDWSQYKESYGENYIRSVVLQELVNDYIRAQVS